MQEKSEKNFLGGDFCAQMVVFRAHSSGFCAHVRERTLKYLESGLLILHSGLFGEPGGEVHVLFRTNEKDEQAGQHSDGHADGYVQEEMLAQIDARIASERGENQTNQTHFLLAGRFGLFGVEESQRGEKREERGGVSRREGVPTVDRKSTRLNSSHVHGSRMPSSA